jgi:lactate dehydrogenase-like 2-hydroxyacid dehydrogenase
MTPRIAITRPIPEAGLQILRAQGYDLALHDDKIMKEDELKKFVADADAILPMLTEKLTAEVIKAAGPQLKAICSFNVGYDNIDMDAAKRHGITVTNTPGSLSGPPVVEQTLNLMFAVARHTVAADQFTRKGKYKQWDPTLPAIVSVPLHAYQNRSAFPRDAAHSILIEEDLDQAYVGGLYTALRSRKDSRIDSVEQRVHAAIHATLNLYSDKN